MKLYLDTSVYGGYYDDEFMEDTQDLFLWINETQTQVIASNIVLEELKRPTEPLKSKLLNTLSFLDNLVFKEFTHKMGNLANYYIVSGVLRPESLEDARHIAFATTHEIDYILSWNFKHMVNCKKQLNVVNLRFNEQLINICSPIDFLNKRRNGKKI